MIEATDSIHWRRVMTLRGRLGRRFAGVVAVCIAAAALAFVNVGSFLAHEDVLSKSDAIFVLGGTRIERPLEGAELYREGYGKYVVLPRDPPEDGVAELARRGVAVPSNADVSREILLRLGVPAGAVLVPDRLHDNTAEEMVTLRELVLRNGWKRVLIVSSRYHLRRASVAGGRTLAGTGVQLVSRASRFDQATPVRWWARRSDIREVVSELPKLAAYWVGWGS